MSEGFDRSDAAAGPGPGPPPDKPVPDRRRAVRYPPTMPRAWLGWMAPEGFRSAPCRLIDIGLGGCRVACREAPPAGVALLLRLEGSLLPAWFELEPLASLHFGPEAHLFRLAFPESCPYELFMAAAFGRASVDAGGKQPSLERFFAGGAVFGPVPREAATRAGGDAADRSKAADPGPSRSGPAFRALHRSSYSHLAR